MTAAQDTYYRAYQDAIAHPDDEQHLTRLLAVYTSGTPARADITARMKGLADRRYAGRPGPQGYYTIEQIDVSSLPPAGQAVAVVCAFDDGVVYDTAHNGPDGKPVVVNDAVESSRSRFRWAQEDGAWKLQGGDVETKWKGENRCPAKSGS